MTHDLAVRRVLNYSAVTDRVLAGRIADKMLENEAAGGNASVWHCLSEVTGTKCWCGPCNPTRNAHEKLALKGSAGLRR